MKPKKTNLISVYIAYFYLARINQTRVNVWIPVISKKSAMIFYEVRYKGRKDSLKKKDLLKSLRTWKEGAYFTSATLSCSFINQVIYISIPELINYLNHCKFNKRRSVIDRCIEALKEEI